MIGMLDAITNGSYKELESALKTASDVDGRIRLELYWNDIEYQDFAEIYF